MQDWFLPNHQFFPPRDYDNNPYRWENRYVFGKESIKNNVNSKKVLQTSKYSHNRPLRYLEPPAINAASSYEKFQKYLNNLNNEVSNFPRNHRPETTVENKKKKKQEERPKYIRDHAPKHLQNLESEVSIKLWF